MISSSRRSRYACESALHHGNSVPARHTIKLIGDPIGFHVCESCLLDYVENVYLTGVLGRHLPFEVAPV